LLRIPGLLYAHDTTGTGVSGPPDFLQGRKALTPGTNGPPPAVGDAEFCAADAKARIGPAAVLLAALIGGAALGLIGALMAIPVAAPAGLHAQHPLEHELKGRCLEAVPDVTDTYGLPSQMPAAPISVPTA
jgi:hypothetical protein